MVTDFLAFLHLLEQDHSNSSAPFPLSGELCSDLYHTHILENFLKILVKVSFFVVLNRFWHVYGGKMVPRAC